MARETNKRIQKEHLILCEGKDAENFLIYYLNSEALKEHPIFSNDFQVIDFGGNDDLPKFLDAINGYPGYDVVSSLLVIRDAERDAEKAKRDVRTAFCKADFPIPECPHEWKEGKKESKSLKAGFLLFPTCDNNPTEGTLEDLCLHILSEEKGEVILTAIEEFMLSLHEKYGREFPHEFKTKLHTYFSVTDDYVSMKVGQAAKKGAFDWNSPKLEPLKNFLLELADSPADNKDNDSSQGE